MLPIERNLPDDIRQMPISDLELLSEEVRDRIIEVTTRNGGHIGASLGAVELIVALLKVFDPAVDKIIFDVGHQAYAYKILTGRNAAFDTLRTYGGISGFPKPSESRYDHFVGGHAGNAVSASCGYAKARTLSGDDYQIVSVLGDGVLANGETAEGLNLVSSLGKQIVVLNDNTYSISYGVGSLHEFLAKLREKPYDGKILRRKKSPFALYDLDYLGPIDGHDISALTAALTAAKESDRSVLLHVVTHKGKGYPLAENNPLKMHGIAPKGEKSGAGFGEVFGETLIKLREKDDKVVAIAAAMAIGTGLASFINKYPDSFVDVGIAESTAVTVAASLARAGYKPYVAIYSTFLQRAYDQILCDVAMEGLNVTFMIDRAGIVGEDGESHQGIYDLALLSAIPDITIASPASDRELSEMMTMLHSRSGVKAIRYPKGSAETGIPTVGDLPHWAILSYGKDGYIVTHGARMVEEGVKAAKLLAGKGLEIGVVNARFLSPIDESFLMSTQGQPLYVAEDVVYAGSLAERLAARGARVVPITLPNTFVTFGSSAELRRVYGIDADGIAGRILHAD